MDPRREFDASSGGHGLPLVFQSSSSSSSPEEMSLREQLAAALTCVHEKEELIRKHAKVSEEAVSGWEEAEREAESLRHNLELTARQNFSLEDKVLELDSALKRYRRQFKVVMQHQEKRFQNILSAKTDQWRSEKFDLENLIIDLAEQLQVAENIINSPKNSLRIRLKNLEMENGELRLEILSLEEQIENRTAERDLIKQHLEKIIENVQEIKPIGSDESRKMVKELEEKITKAETEKLEMEERLKESRDNLIVAQRKAGESERMKENLLNELLIARNAVDAAESRALEMQEKVRWFEKNTRIKYLQGWR